MTTLSQFLLYLIYLYMEIIILILWVVRIVALFTVVVYLNSLAGPRCYLPGGS